MPKNILHKFYGHLIPKNLVEKKIKFIIIIISVNNSKKKKKFMATTSEEGHLIGHLRIRSVLGLNHLAKAGQIGPNRAKAPRANDSNQFILMRNDRPNWFRFLVPITGINEENISFLTDLQSTYPNGVDFVVFNFPASLNLIRI